MKNLLKEELFKIKNMMGITIKEDIISDFESIADLESDYMLMGDYPKDKEKLSEKIECCPSTYKKGKYKEITDPNGVEAKNYLNKVKLYNERIDRWNENVTKLLSFGVKPTIYYVESNKEKVIYYIKHGNITQPPWVSHIYVWRTKVSPDGKTVLFNVNGKWLKHPEVSDDFFDVVDKSRPNSTLDIYQHFYFKPTPVCVLCVEGKEEETAREDDITIKKVDKLEDAQTITDIPKSFVLTGSYWCNGKNSMGRGADNSTYKEQCKNLPDGVDKSKFMASWEIKFAPNVAGNPDTVPVTRWNLFYNSSGEIYKITSYDYNKIALPYQETMKRLYGNPNDNPEITKNNFKQMMYVAAGDTNDIWDNNIEPLLVD
jgi:hypothetical protein